MMATLGRGTGLGAAMTGPLTFTVLQKDVFEIPLYRLEKDATNLHVFGVATFLPAT
jgi:hypothetical protein